MTLRRRKIDYEKLILTVVMLLPIVIVSLNLDNDFWFLLNHGRYIVENGFPVTEPFTIHAGMEFMIQQWLFDVILYYLFTAFGKAGVMAFIFLCALLVLYLTFRLCMLLSGRKFCLSALLTTVCCLFMCLWYMVSRPQIITYLVLLTQLLCMEKYARSGKWKYLIPLPLLSVLQVNAHAAMWWMMIAFALPYLVESLNFKWFRNEDTGLRKGPLLIALGAMLAVGPVNPYGIRAILYVLRSIQNKTIGAKIMEMAPPDLGNMNGVIFFVLLFLVVLCYVLNRKGRFQVRYVLLTLGTTLLALMSIKSIAYFIMGTLIPLAYYLKNLGDKLVLGAKEKPRQLQLLAGFMTLVLAASVFVAWDMYDGEKDYPPTKAAVEYLKEHEDTSDVRLYVDFYNGGYAEYCGFKAYIDPRAEVFLEVNNKKEDIFEEFISLQAGRIHYQEFLEKYSFTHILLTEGDALDVYLSKDARYEIYYEDPLSKIYILKTE